MAEVDMSGTATADVTSPGASQLADKIDSGAMDVYSPVTVDKPTPFTFDLGNLCAFDPNPLAHDPDEETIAATARDAAQALINQLLNTCQVKSTSDGVHLVLPAPTTPIPREKPIPAAKPPTKWELFAAKKGIKDKKREGKLIYDEATGDWVPKWGYKGKNKEGDNEWLVEVDAEKEKETGEAGDKRKEYRAERMERIKRNERKQRANERNTRKTAP
jgi:regulator of ribosome biosynthesis